MINTTEAEPAQQRKNLDRTAGPHRPVRRSEEHRVTNPCAARCHPGSHPHNIVHRPNHPVRQHDWEWDVTAVTLRPRRDEDLRHHDIQLELPTGPLRGVYAPSGTGQLLPHKHAKVRARAAEPCPTPPPSPPGGPPPPREDRPSRQCAQTLQARTRTPTRLEEPKGSPTSRAREDRETNRNPHRTCPLETAARLMIKLPPPHQASPPRHIPRTTPLRPRHIVAPILDADSQGGPVIGPSRQVIRVGRPSRTQSFVR